MYFTKGIPEAKAFNEYYKVLKMNYYTVVQTINYTNKPKANTDSVFRLAPH